MNKTKVMNKKSFGMLGNIMALALMAESFDQSFLADDKKGTNKLTPKDIDTTPKQTRPAAGCKEYWFNKNGGFYNGECRPMRRDESVFYCHAINDNSAKKKFDKWEREKSIVKPNDE
jgi:hypothetical protein